MKPNDDMNHELIDRWLDGTATTEEADQLFATAANDSSVRSEMQAAVAMRNTVDREIAATMVPEDMYASIVTKAQTAGALPPAASILSGSALTVIGTAVSVLAGAAAIAIIGWNAYKPMIADTAAASGNIDASGSVVAQPVITPGSTIERPRALPAVSPEGRNDGQAATDGPTGTMTVSPSDAKDMDEVLNRTSTPAQTHDGTIGTIRNRHRQDAATMDGSMPLSLRNDRDDRRRQDDMPPSAESLRPPVEPVTSITMATPVAIGHQSAATRPSSETTTATPSTLDVPDMSYPSQRIMEVRVIQQPLSGASGTNGDIWNLGVELDLKLSDIHAIGAGIHRSAFSYTMMNADGTLSQQTSMTWADLHWRTMPMIDLGMDIRPFLQLAVGGSSRGGIVEPAVGLQKSFGPLNVSAGADLMTFVYQNHGRWSAMVRPSLRLGLGLRW